MWCYRSGQTAVVQAPAKLNLFFEVLGKRSDGFHEIETLMCPISLYDSVRVTASGGETIDFVCRPGSAAVGSATAGPRPDWMIDVPAGPANLVVRALELLRRHSGVRTGARVELFKRIPTAAGLGGGSSDAAAALVAACAAWNLNVSGVELARLAGELGSDVPFFLAGGPALCRGRGEVVEPVAGLGAPWFVVVRPGDGLSTPTVYRACRPALSPRPWQPLVEAMRRGDWAAVGRCSFNRLEEAAASLSPSIARLRRLFDGFDTLGHLMSGSGTSYFAWCRHRRHALALAGRLSAAGAQNPLVVQACH